MVVLAITACVLTASLHSPSYSLNGQRPERERLAATSESAWQASCKRASPRTFPLFSHILCLF